MFFYKKAAYDKRLKKLQQTDFTSITTINDVIDIMGKPSAVNYCCKSDHTVIEKSYFWKKRHDDACAVQAVADDKGQIIKIGITDEHGYRVRTYDNETYVSFE